MTGHALASHLLPHHNPAVWRGMTDVIPVRPMAGIALMTFDGTMHQFALSDLELWRMVEQIADSVPGERARQLRTFFQRSRATGRAAE